MWLYCGQKLGVAGGQVGGKFTFHSISSLSFKICLIFMYFLFIKFEWPQIISLEWKTIWNICVFSSHFWACHLLLCPVPLTLMTWEAGTDSRLTLKWPPTSKAYWYLFFWFVWLTLFLFPPPALAAYEQLLAKNPGHCWEGPSGEEYPMPEASGITLTTGSMRHSVPASMSHWQRL